MTNNLHQARLIKCLGELIFRRVRRGELQKQVSNKETYLFWISHPPEK